LRDDNVIFLRDRAFDVGNLLLRFERFMGAGLKSREIILGRLFPAD
jgi:hypothetical protein